MGKSEKPSKSNGQVEEPFKKVGKKEEPDSLSSADTDMSSGNRVQSAKGTRAASSGDNAALFAPCPGGIQRFSRTGGWPHHKD